MNKLYPIAKPETRHLFISPAIHQEWEISNPDYEGLKTSYLKPGKVPNLMELTRPADVRYSITEEPDMETFAITGIIYGVMDVEGYWHVCTSENLSVKMTRESAATWSLDGVIAIPPHQVFPATDHVVDFGEAPILVPVKLHYARGTRCLQISTSGTYDNGKPELYGITVNMDHKDSKVVA